MILLLIFIGSCREGKVKKINQEVYDKYISVGHDIAVEAQKTLLMNVSQAMQLGGPEYAVDFCHLKALPIIDSLNAQCNCQIIRITPNNRNPDNNLKDRNDHDVWRFYSRFESPEGFKDTVLAGEDNSIIYYKPITIAMPACLKCHGTPGTDINEVTLAKIEKLYPEDKAMGYHEGELRGLWKIVFE